MRKEETFEQYWIRVGAYLGCQDTIAVVEGEDDWEGDEVIEFRDSCGSLISRYNKDREIAEYNW